MISFLTQLGDAQYSSPFIWASDKRPVDRTELDRTETAAWYGRGEVPAERHWSYSYDWQPLIQRTKPAISGLYAVQGDGRYVHTVG